MTSNTSLPISVDTDSIINAAKLIAMFSNKSVSVNPMTIADAEVKYSNEIKYVKTLIGSNPEVFDSISTHLNNIVSDGKIDIHDIPEIVLILSTIVKINFRKIVNHISVLSVVEYMLHVLLTSKLLPLPPVEKALLNKVVDVSFKLLEAESAVIEADCKTCWLSCCRK